MDMLRRSTSLITRGWTYRDHPTGRIDIDRCCPSKTVQYGVNRVLPLVESRAVFELDIWELDNISRGAKDPELAPLDLAAREIALFEEKAVYSGLAATGIEGLSSARGSTSPLESEDPRGIVKAISEAVFILKEKAVEGPYAFVASPALWRIVYGGVPGYPTSKHVTNLVDQVILSTQDDSYVVSTRGGDLELVLGQDFSLGFEERNGDKVRLFLAESFTFRVISPEAVVQIV